MEATVITKLIDGSVATQAEMLTIRYLGWIAENLTGDIYKGKPSPSDIRAAHKCCDLIEHIAQYITEGLDWPSRARALAQDVEFMRYVLKTHTEKVGVGQSDCLPTPMQLDVLQTAFSE